MSVADPGFPEGRQSLRYVNLIFDQFFLKLHENEEIVAEVDVWYPLHL